MYSIMQYQYDFFSTGDDRKLKPMILKDIAEITALDISTVSRVANSKFVQTEFGTRRLKDFFSESLQTSTGEEVSTLEVKKILTDIIEEENKRKPYSDEKLKNMLQEKGYNIARRTVAKGPRRKRRAPTHRKLAAKILRRISRSAMTRLHPKPKRRPRPKGSPRSPAAGPARARVPGRRHQKPKGRKRLRPLRSPLRRTTAPRLRM